MWIRGSVWGSTALYTAPSRPFRAPHPPLPPRISPFRPHGPPAAMTVARWFRLAAQGRFLHLGAPDGAGHNRWSKVRHVKGQRDGQRAQLIQRLCGRLRAAVACEWAL
uniref:Uncharacterized protein n=1 Tax=Meleagris gallopavo TaxID=9103 RepID=A0A803XK08_MELGA